MNKEINTYPNFYISRKLDCSYLHDCKERKVFTLLDQFDQSHIHSQLVKQGFRRSQNILYRPNCSGCEACISVRVIVDQFKPTRSQKRVKNKNRNIIRKLSKSSINQERYDLFKKYLKHRHDDGHMQKMSIDDFNDMSSQPSIQSFNVEYYESVNDERANVDDAASQITSKLVGSSITDIIDDGLSMVYSYFDPDYESMSLGKYIILDHIELAREHGLKYVYLGYLIKQSKKMSYKSTFLPQQHFIDGSWQNSNELVIDNIKNKRDISSYDISDAAYIDDVFNKKILK